jgi:hypothetical protein
VGKSFYISFWAGDLAVANTLPAQLKILYSAIGSSEFVKDPEVCAERELVPIQELLEPFSLSNESQISAAENATAKSLKLAGVLVAIYTRLALEDVKTGPECGLRFIGSFMGSEYRL